MATVTITSKDTLTLFDRVFEDFADTDVSTITFNDDLVAVKTGKNRNSIYSSNEMGNNADVVLRIMRGSSDDRFLQGKLNEMQKDLPSFQLANGEFVKRLGDGQGNVQRDVSTLSGGVFMRKVDSKENTEGDTEQGVAVYNMKFTVVDRNIQ